MFSCAVLSSQATLPGFDVVLAGVQKCLQYRILFLPIVTENHVGTFYVYL